MKKLFFLLVNFWLFTCFGQQNLQWKGYFSFNQVKDLSESSNRVFVAAENAIFTKNFATGEVRTSTTLQGLSGETITAMYHSDTFNRTVLGYQNGLMLVVNDSDGSVLNVVDIINKSIPNNIKKVNHFFEYNGILYVSCDFGIVQYNLANLEFGDTYYIGPNGQEIKIHQTTVFNNEIYAVSQYNGILKANINNPNLIDFAQWQTWDSGSWNGIVSFNNQIYASNNNNRVYRNNGSGFVEVLHIGQPILDIRTFGDYMIVTSANHVYVFNSSGIQSNHIQSSLITEETVTFTCATVQNNTIYIGTDDNGLISLPINTNDYEIIMPDGPSRNKIFSISFNSNTLWAVYGGYDISYNPYTYIGYNLTQFGVSKLFENQWKNIPYSEVLGAKSISRITINPNDANQVFASSYHNGLLKIESDVPTEILNGTNSGLESLDTGNLTEAIRIGPTTFDKNGNMWVMNARIKNGLKVLKSNNQWQSFNMENILQDYSSSGDYAALLVDKNGTKWIASNNDGVIAFNESANEFKKIMEGEDVGNLPSNDVRAMAIDNRSQLWIGTNKGLRVLSSIGAYNSDSQMKANSIIILEDGLAQELLYEQFITDIKIDGSNRKWIGTADSGVFLFSSDGQKTIYHFTKDNSPLPSNTINDIDINDETGEIFFATEKGMVSFLGTSTKPSDNLDNVYVYPNPVRPDFVGTVKIAGLVSKANIKITDIGGNLVYETTSEGGTIEWDTSAFGKYKVASGVYMIFVASEDGSETTVKKVMIVR